LILPYTTLFRSCLSGPEPGSMSRRPAALSGLLFNLPLQNQNSPTSTKGCRISRGVPLVRVHLYEASNLTKKCGKAAHHRGGQPRQTYVLAASDRIKVVLNRLRLILDGEVLRVQGTI